MKKTDSNCVNSIFENVYIKPMRKIHHIFACMVLLLAMAPLTAQIDPMSPLPLDESVRYGVLDNGMTYYIKANQEPKERASFYIIQNVGALLEEDHQDGLAHFLEHMAFNRTKHFPDKGIIDFLERHGVAFGENINAYTSFNETVYNLSDVPITKPGIIDSSLLILHDWSNYLLLTEEEIDAERGVIKEEWRTRRNAGYRMFMKSLPIILPESQFAKRDVIGSMDVIENFDYDDLRSFYHDWYRTDLQAIAIVGDFDVDEMEQRVIDRYAPIPAVENPKERPFFSVPDQEEPAFAVITDKEASNTGITLYIRHAKEEARPTTFMDLRESYIEDLFGSMMGMRIQELLQKGDPPFVTGGMYYTDFVRGYEAFVVSVTPKPNEEAKGLEAMLTELERVKRHGFTQGELDRAIADQLSSWEKYYNQRDKVSNEQWIRQLQAHYLEQEAYLAVETEYELVQALLPTITLQDFDDRLRQWIVDKNNALIIQGPEGEGHEHLNEEEAMAIFASVAAADVEPYTEEELAESLVNEDLAPAAIVSERETPLLNGVEWTLANGAKVVYQQADYEKDEVQVRAYSKGGSSLYEDPYVPTTSMLTTLVNYYGIGDFDAMGLQKMMSGKTVSLDLSLGRLSEGFSASSSVKDFETLMQLIYLGFEHPRFDEEAHQAIVARYVAFLENMNNNPQKIMSDSLSLIATDYHPRTRTMDPAFMEEINYEWVKEVYTDRFADASDFVFIIVGNVEADEARRLAQTYLGAITDLDRTETWVDRGLNEPEGRVEKVITMPMETPKANVNILLKKEYTYSPESRMAFRVIENILDLRYTESIREEEGGTYGVSVRTGFERMPSEKANIQIRFDCDPEKAADLKSKIYVELEKLAKEGPSQVDLDKTVENILKAREESKEHNAFIMNNFYTWYVHGIDYSDEANYEEVAKSLTVKDIKKFMKRFYKKPNVVDVTFMPEVSETEEGDAASGD